MEKGQISGRIVPNGDRPPSAIARGIEESYGIRDKRVTSSPTSKVHVRGIPVSSSASGEQTPRLPILREVRAGYSVVEGGLPELLAVVQTVIESKRGPHPK